MQESLAPATEHCPCIHVHGTPLIFQFPVASPIYFFRSHALIGDGGGAGGTFPATPVVEIFFLT